MKHPPQTLKPTGRNHLCIMLGVRGVFNVSLKDW